MQFEQCTPYFFKKYCKIMFMKPIFKPLHQMLPPQLEKQKSQKNYAKKEAKRRQNAGKKELKKMQKGCKMCEKGCKKDAKVCKMYAKKMQKGCKMYEKSYYAHTPNLIYLA